LGVVRELQWNLPLRNQSNFQKMIFSWNNLLFKLVSFTTSLKLSLILLLCAGISSMNFDILMNGTQSGKSFVFFFGIGLISVTAIVKFWVSPPRPTNAKISILDFLLLAFILYLFFRNDWAELTGSLLFLELVGLAVLYIIIRQLSLQSYLWIFMALTLGGLVQAIYGNLQLWGYFPSHHGIFKMTGSFFNPGPYAGYLATIFPI
jgi:hypothetical protein